MKKVFIDVPTEGRRLEDINETVRKMHACMEIMTGEELEGVTFFDVPGSEPAKIPDDIVSAEEYRSAKVAIIAAGCDYICSVSGMPFQESPFNRGFRRGGTIYFEAALVCPDVFNNKDAYDKRFRRHRIEYDEPCCY